MKTEPNTETWYYGTIYLEGRFPYSTGYHKDLDFLKEIFKNANVIEWRSIDINLTTKQDGDNS